MDYFDPMVPSVFFAHPAMWGKKRDIKNEKKNNNYVCIIHSQIKNNVYVKTYS